jgi:hypothetical protein
MQTKYHSRKTRLTDQEFQQILILKTTCNTGFFLPSLEESYTALILYGHNFKSFVALLAEDFDTPTSVKKIFYFPFVQYSSYHLETFPLFCILFFYTALSTKDIFMKLSAAFFFHDTCFA